METWEIGDTGESEIPQPRTEASESRVSGGEETQTARYCSLTPGLSDVSPMLETREIMAPGSNNSSLWPRLSGQPG